MTDFDFTDFDFIEKDDLIFDDKDSECVVVGKNTHSGKTQEDHE